ncbi:MAG: CsgG/HfaB family protein [Candidatus Electrothrix sp. GW3-4]|uniref:CsgG/HfaB family protein n=1 Tax=Candidatus Electrothrix sp. GW3-4 TaxID=3126740 RepID=UPI0030D2F9F8
MSYTPFFRGAAATLIWLYSAALAQASQVVTQTERDWAKQAIQQEKALSTQGAASPSNSLAVLYFNNKSGQDKLSPLQKGLAVMLITDLAKVEQLRVVERVRMQALLDELELGSSGLVDAGTVPKVGRLLGAAKVTSGDILKGRDEKLEISSSVLDIPLDKIAGQTTAAGALADLFQLEKEILFHIIDSLQITLSPQKKTELEQPLSASTPALLALFLGIEYSDQGLYELAAKMYNQALTEDPYLEIAKDALQELKGMGLIRSEGEKMQEAEEAEPSEPAAESGGGISAGTVVGIGLGLAAVGAGVYYGVEAIEDEIEGVPPTIVNVDKPDIAGCTDEMTVTFSEPMKEAYAVISPSEITTQVTQSWTSSETLKVSWTVSSSLTITIDVSNLRDTDDNALELPGDANPISFDITCQSLLM